MVKIVKNPGNGRLNNLNYPVLNVLICLCLYGERRKIARLTHIYSFCRKKCMCYMGSWFKNYCGHHVLRTSAHV